MKYFTRKKMEYSHEITTTVLVLKDKFIAQT